MPSMITIVRPIEHIDKIWGKQRIKENKSYRLMKYVLRAEFGGKVLLHNVVTGHLIVLEQEEKKIIENLPFSYKVKMDDLINYHFLVPERYDEHQQVVNLRTILLKLNSAGDKPITGYTILPTTSCNARCYYCFEQNVRKATMSEQTANQVVDFITEHCGEEKKVSIVWFGGEPTVASQRIDQICEGLRKKGILFTSSMITNGFLFDKILVDKAKHIWNLKALQICVDGTEISYNKIKSYVCSFQSAYQKVMDNIGLLLEVHIRVGLRMNYDLENYHEFEDLLKDVLGRFGTDENLNVSAFPIIGDFPSSDGKIHHGSDEWLAEKKVELNNLSSCYGLRHSKTMLPSLNLQTCMAYNESSIVIRPDGGLSRCAELFDDKDLIGDLQRGITRLDVVDSWKQIADYDFCQGCVLFPNCFRLVNCRNKSYCIKIDDLVNQYIEKMKKEYKSFAD